MSFIHAGSARTCSTRQGFTLVELSIVLVIIGLLVGGVLSGQSLIRAAELRSVISDSTKYTTAINAFRDKYFALPGDMTNATAFWGTDTGCPSNTNQTPRTATCNGTGDGVVGSWTPTNTIYESFRAMQHMANAGLIEGIFSGVSGTGGDAISNVVVGVNAPRGKINNVGWMLWNVTGAAYAYYGFATGEAFNTMQVGTTGTGANMNNGAFLKNEEAWNIDTKTDDGLPLTGQVRAFPVASCASAAALTATYVLSNATPSQCGLNFILR